MQTEAQEDTGRPTYQRERLDARTVQTIEDCDRHMHNTIVSLTRVKQAIAEAHRTAAAGGGYADPKWLARTEAARHALGQLHQELTKRRAELVREAKEARHRAHEARDAARSTEWSKAFRQVVRERYGEAVFFDIVAEAHRRAGEG